MTTSGNGDNMTVKAKMYLLDSDEYWDAIRASYMVELDGEILGIFVNNDEGIVTVKKLDSYEMHWTKVEGIGNKCIYVSYTSQDVNGLTHCVRYSTWIKPSI
ncbi:hypothetical protein BUALT_Bualt13G0112500 [Buddleja alternifolia]|uniref:Uncharacterized protein n=1 Tax=Buddleja alternifolia TaxID=168488 RepID=A0AAV6WU90_9LAMI|nr:hypothetical protein BUALT_Bualt13G0112500 [Buddleja alternifolia]